MPTANRDRTNHMPPPVPHPKAHPHIFRQILEEPGVYWHIHDLRGVSRAFKDIIDEIQCKHLIVHMCEPDVVTGRVGYKDEIKTLRQRRKKPGAMTRFSGEEFIHPDEEYRITITDITCAVRELWEYQFHIPCLRALWEDPWDSVARRRPLGFISKYTKSVAFRIDPRPGLQQYSKSKYTPPEIKTRQVIGALQSKIRGVRGARNWLTDTIPSWPQQSFEPGFDWEDYRKRRHSFSLRPLEVDVIYGAWSCDGKRWQRRWPTIEPPRPSSETHVIHIHYDNPVPTPEDIASGMLDDVVATIAGQPSVDWIVVGDEKILDQFWIGPWPPGTGTVEARLQRAVAAHRSQLDATRPRSGDDSHLVTGHVRFLTPGQHEGGLYGVGYRRKRAMDDHIWRLPLVFSRKETWPTSKIHWYEQKGRRAVRNSLKKRDSQ